MLKPAETTPASIAELARLAAPFLPRGLFNVVCGGRDTGRALVDHPSVAMISVTGSVAAGRDIAMKAGRSRSTRRRSMSWSPTLDPSGVHTIERLQPGGPRLPLKDEVAPVWPQCVLTVDVLV